MAREQKAKRMALEEFAGVSRGQVTQGFVNHDRILSFFLSNQTIENF